MATIKKACKGGLYPKSSSVSRRLKTGGNLGMKSVKAGIDKNPGVTRADIIAAATKKAKKGAIVKKSNLSAGVSSTNKRVGPVDPSGAYTKVQKRTLGSMKKGGSMKKCKYGCK